VSQTLPDCWLRHCSQQKEHCTTFAKTITRLGTDGAPDICDVELNALLFELSVMKFNLPDTPMSTMEPFEFVRESDCYPNIGSYLLYT
jgi:hypothetical protein